MKETQEQAKAAVRAVMAISEAIRELGRVPSGVLYAQLMAHMDLAAYNRIIDILKGAGVVKEEFHELVWTGPAAIKEAV